MKPNAILILSNVLSNINETYKTDIKLNHRDNHDDYEIVVTESSMVKVVFSVLLALEINTLNFYVKESDTFVVF
jgi:hypothetical protein